MTNKYPAKCIVCGKQINPGEGMCCGEEHPDRQFSKLAWQHKIFCIVAPKDKNVDNSVIEDQWFDSWHEMQMD